MAVLYNSVCAGLVHVPFDAALAVSAHLAFPDDPLSFLGEARHLAAVRELAGSRIPVATFWLPMTVRAEAHPGVHQRFLDEWQMYSTALAEARKTGARHVIACDISAPGLLATTARTFVDPNGPVTGIIHHGELGRIIGSRRSAWLLRDRDPAHLRQIVLGHAIRDNVISHPNGPNHIGTIRHPYLFPDVAGSEWPVAGPVRFGFIGTARREKGFHHFCQFAAASAREGRAAEFELIGTLDHEYITTPPLGMEFLTTVRWDERVPKASFDDRLASVTYAVLPLDQVEYRLACSGSVMDAFAFAKPIIALRNEQLNRYFEDMGDIGYLCDSVAEMNSLFNLLVVEAPRRRYTEQSQNILRGRLQFSPEQVANDLREALAGKQRAVDARPATG